MRVPGRRQRQRFFSLKRNTNYMAISFLRMGTAVQTNSETSWKKEVLSCRFIYGACPMMTHMQKSFGSNKQCNALRVRSSGRRRAGGGNPLGRPGLVLGLAVYLCSLREHVPDARQYDWSDDTGTARLVSGRRRFLRKVRRRKLMRWAPLGWPGPVVLVMRLR